MKEKMKKQHNVRMNKDAIHKLSVMKKFGDLDKGEIINEMMRKCVVESEFFDNSIDYYFNIYMMNQKHFSSQKKSTMTSYSLRVDYMDRLRGKLDVVGEEDKRARAKKLEFNRFLMSLIDQRYEIEYSSEKKKIRPFIEHLESMGLNPEHFLSSDNGHIYVGFKKTEVFKFSKKSKKN